MEVYCNVVNEIFICIYIVYAYGRLSNYPPVASAPTNLIAVQEGPTSIRVSWSPPTPLGDTTGYRIYYSGGSSGSVNVSDGSTDNYLLIGLQDEESYDISIVATSQHLPSESIAADMKVMLGEDIHDLIMHEMQGKATQHNRKTRQHNTTCPG